MTTPTTAPLTTWLPVPEGTADVFALLPAGYDELRALYASLWDAGVDAVTLELCRLRIATLVRSTVDLAARDPHAVDAGLDETLVAALPEWPTSTRFTDRRRAAIALAEQFVIDPHGFTDADASAAHEHFDAAELTTLTIAIAVFDALARVRALLAVSAERTTLPVHDAAIGVAYR
jgi:alkylhydroperoxidase family enzyme